MITSRSNDRDLDSITPTSEDLIAAALTAPDSLMLARLPQFDERCLETVCAMANASGGTIIIEASNGTINTSDLVAHSDMSSWLQEITARIYPTVFPTCEIREFNAQQWPVLEVGEAPVKPVSLDGRCFRRVGGSNVLMSTADIAQLYLQSAGQSWDATPLENASLDDLDAHKLEEFVRRTNERRQRKLPATAPLVELLEKLLLLRNGQLTKAAILLFGRSPQDHFPYASLKAGRFKSETVIIDEQEIAGDLFAQIEQAFVFIRKHLTVRLVISGQVEREEVWDYPLEALREGLINAVCHRDYATPVETQIRIYDDHIMIWNGGELLHNLTIADLKGRHPSVLRNRLIASVFYDAGLIEKWGSGTNRIVDECKKLGLPEPEWRSTNGVALFIRKEHFTEESLLDLGLSERQILAVQHVKKKRRVTNQEYQLLAQVKKRTASEDLRQLEEKGILERVGSTGKGTYYRLRNKGA